MRDKSEDSGPGWFQEFAGAEFSAEFLETCQMSKEKLINLVRNVWELECLVRALDSMETLSSLAGLSREYVFRFTDTTPSCLLTTLATGKTTRHARCGNIRAKRFGQPRRACNQS